MGTAWLASGLVRDTTLFTIERDAERATAAGGLFRTYPGIYALHGDARELLAHGPLRSALPGRRPQRQGHLNGSAGPDEADVAAVLAALRSGGLIVLDELTPERNSPLSGAGARTAPASSG